ncbi:tripartite tricarboxylate transporter TctB family protein [Starkeya sp. ORNL1]|uniref:tripartite tricarboxylate transporter TctB family protein n=1 Tax=Starkeya sp. ORNL1 TaxID=2709380 RepID=UPI00146413B0|nr:tripartite tricarboxylate transporter TctB family protein [Starkeya sp. ORNL1]QJP17108.1 tripartite tricarboxylate transporter TctB family protein [Starkeya sp. ORNL1]
MEISRPAMEVVTAATTALIGAVVCYGSLQNGIEWADGGPQPGYFPFYVGCLIMLGSAATALQALMRREAGSAPFLDGERLRTVAAFFLPIVGFALISGFLGLYIGMGIYVFYAMWTAAKFRPHVALLIALLVVAVNFIIFEELFMVPLLKGPVLNHFGIY